MANPLPVNQPSGSQLNDIWFTRCPVPTATGLAYKLGWLEEEFAKDGISVATIQDAPKALARHHYDHEITSLIREGGSLLALAAKAQGAKTKVIGLTWIDEWQVILVSKGSPINRPADLKGRRIALPAYVDREIQSHVRGSSIARGMTLQGVKGVLAYAGLTLDDVSFVEVGSGQGSDTGLGSLWSGLDSLARGEVDAVYVKGASAVDAAKRYGAIVGIDIDRITDRRYRVNNGTPRPITVHEDLIENHFELLVRFLGQTLRAADWAASNLDGVHKILKEETRAGDDGVATAYRDGFHQSLHPSLSKELMDLFRIQKNFTLIHGVLDHDFNLDTWIDPRPLAAARQWLDNYYHTQEKAA
ncbi:ABC transporter substrate-binding protein [Methylotenera mobilis]|uniref:Monooxygenase, putative n=1 Tax=Methylotenera mobilis (strain JLW8 / ATCC BAA-1282 / DSM 17540) TaxID=583345 RepID=C6WYP7_METML|nr:ABC transporter substrate-binding protein [Methylotenera mobilis]ACT47022.1 monooxygenase, putative [Methylotenera mobilis JLW8]